LTNENKDKISLPKTEIEAMEDKITKLLEDPMWED